MTEALHFEGVGLSYLFSYFVISWLENKKLEGENPHPT